MVGRIADMGEKHQTLMSKVSEDMEMDAGLNKIFNKLSKMHEKLGKEYSKLQMNMEREDYLKLVTMTGWLFGIQDLNYSRNLIEGARAI